MGTTTRDFDFDDFGLFTTGAELVLLAENLGELVEVVASFTVGLEVGPHGGAARGDGGFHDLFGVFEEGG